ncbi:recombination mediator RecR [Peptoniphilus indolicus]|uniref:Recombination protein RecR n=2 Tax=Peptoniphilus indolicus TaxID=33030 RepID=G4D4W9_9FIRM|nr:recombination mediator RecR [Peptoniphilus indolicus]EGY79417.1 recombination protein R [Peptoniphilus indolicus ATCC 29427]SUB74602.1 Recombination protein RecR [Peptoniphilus indolicus]
MAKRAKSIEQLISQLNKLPGIGSKTAQRLAYHVIDMKDEEVRELSNALLEAKQNIHKCEKCQNFTDEEVCDICKDNTRDMSTICVVEYPKDVEALERSNCYHGLYHVLHGTISPSRAIHADELSIGSLIKRLETEDIKEIIVATNPTTEGDTTALYISRLIEPLGIKVSRIGYGLPVGGDLEYYDEITISTALENRRTLNRNL